MRVPTAAIRRGLLLGVLVTLVAGCNREPEPASDAPRKKAAAPVVAAPVDPAAAAVAEATAGMVAGVTASKSRARVNTYFDLKAKPQPGAAFSVEVAVVPGIAVPGMTIEVTGTDGLTILSPAEPQRMEQVQSDTVQSFEVTARAAKPGIQLVNVNVSLEEPGGVSAQNFVYPVLVGGVAIAPAPPPAKPAKDKKAPPKTAKPG